MSWGIRKRDMLLYFSQSMHYISLVWDPYEPRSHRVNLWLSALPLRVAPPITAPFHSKVSIFTAPYLDNYWVRNEKTSDLDMGRRPELKSEVFFMRTQ